MWNSLKWFTNKHKPNTVGNIYNTELQDQLVQDITVTELEYILSLHKKRTQHQERMK